MKGQAAELGLGHRSELVEGSQEPGVVVPLFRGRQEVSQPLVTLGNGRWTKRDVMREFAVSDRTVERWMKEQGLPYEKPFGPGRGPVRFVPRAVLAWWEARCANSRLAVGAVVLVPVLAGWLS